MSGLHLSWTEEPRRAELLPPVSKSHAMRYLLLRFARGERTEMPEGPLPDDVKAVESGLATIASGASEIAIDAGLGGAPLRFLLALAAMTPGVRCSLDASEPLRKRPHGPLITALKTALENYGLQLAHHSWPLNIDTQNLALPEVVTFSLEPSSSQYLSGLSLASAVAIAAKRCREVNIRLESPVASAGYAELTAACMADAGFKIETSTSLWRITGFHKKPWEPKLPLDWSSAAYLLVWAWKSGGAVRVTNRVSHPDGIILDILSNAGLDVQLNTEGMATVSGELKRGLEACALESPDLIPLLGVLALAAPDTSRFERLAILANKESDRLQFLLEVTEEAGGQAEVRGDTIIVHPATARNSNVNIRTRYDHRRAMAGSLLVALGWPAVIIDNAECVSKSFPDYWEQLNLCGVRAERV